jgi:hypothetical protein
MRLKVSVAVGVKAIGEPVQCRQQRRDGGSHASRVCPEHSSHDHQVCRNTCQHQGAHDASQREANADLFLSVHGCLPAIDGFQSGRATSQEQETLLHNLFVPFGPAFIS